MYTLVFATPLVLGVEMVEQKQKLTIELFEDFLYDNVLSSITPVLTLSSFTNPSK